MTRFRTLLALLALLAATAAVAVAAGCGGAGTSLTAEPLTPEALSLAATASAEAGSSRFALDFELSFPGAAGSFAFSGEGAFDAKSERATMTVDLSSFAGLFGALSGGLGVPGQGGPDTDAWKIDAIVDGKVAYLRFPALASELPEGKSWVKVDASEPASFGELGFSGLEDFTQEDPRAFLRVLEQVSGEIETVGTEELRGTETTHYRGTLDLASLGDLAPKTGGGAEDFGAMFEQLLEQAGLSELPFDVWLDGDGLVRKVAASLSMTPPGESGEAEASMSFELYDYGVEVDVTPPPADEVVDAAALQD